MAVAINDEEHFRTLRSADAARVMTLNFWRLYVVYYCSRPVYFASTWRTDQPLQGSFWNQTPIHLEDELRQSISAHDKRRSHAQYFNM
jgi:hypothetical protein